MAAKTEMPQGLAFLRTQLSETEADVAAAVAAGSWQAVFAGRRLVLQIRSAIEDAEAVEAAQAMSLAPEEAREKMAEAAADMPDEDLVVFVKAYCDRHELDWPKRVIVGGQRG
jgi:hypothetical protein